MSDVKRYDPMGYDKLSGYMQQHPDGDYVHHDDYATLEAELAKLRAELERRAADVSAMARVLSDRAADACNIDCDDNWAMYGQEYIDDAQAMLAAATSAPKADDPVKVQLLEALEAIAAEDYKAPHDATDFAISFEKGLCIGRIKRTARAAIAAARQGGKV